MFAPGACCQRSGCPACTATAAEGRPARSCAWPLNSAALVAGAGNCHQSLEPRGLRASSSRGCRQPWPRPRGRHREPRHIRKCVAGAGLRRRPRHRSPAAGATRPARECSRRSPRGAARARRGGHAVAGGHSRHDPRPRRGASGQRRCWRRRVRGRLAPDHRAPQRGRRVPVGPMRRPRARFPEQFRGMLRGGGVALIADGEKRRQPGTSREAPAWNHRRR
mmetsp:Transcript_36953/g.106641  ORF Transcript_36953/g.106641 Transcript_36953/m.106641 type:complete len:221 (+) Transcript_36953:223-885(+)